MSTKLGRGLDALIPTGDESIDISTGIKKARINQIYPNPYQPRMNIDPGKLQELANSLTESGMIQPIIVTKRKDSGYELIAGERRLEAAKLAGFTEVPVIVRSVTPKEQLQYALIENIQRENLNPIEEAKAYSQLQQQFKLTHSDIAKFVGKERSTVTNSLRLLKLTPDIQQLIIEDQISQGHARVLLSLKAGEQKKMAGEIIQKQLSVRETESKIRKLLTGPEPQKETIPAEKKRRYLDKITSTLKKNYGFPVRIISGKKGGSLLFTYKNEEELVQLINKLLNKK